MRRDARQHIAEPGERLDRIAFARCDEAHQYGGRSTAGIPAKKCPVVTANRDVAVGPFRGAVVALQITFLQIARQRFPLVQRSNARPSCRALKRPGRRTRRQG